MKSTIAVLATSLVAATAASYSPCPLIGNYFPAPSRDLIDQANLSSKFETAFSDLVKNSGHPDFGPISANTTSFSVVYFSGDTGSSTNNSPPVIFEYHHTAPYDVSQNVSAVSADTKFPLAEVTMVFTVYSWLIAVGDGWDTPITEYLPELKPQGKDAFSLSWSDITVGSLAGHLSGLPRTSTACTVGASCDAKKFLADLEVQGPTFLAGSTPIVSYAAFQVLALAMERSQAQDGTKNFAEIMHDKLLGPIGAKRTSFIKGKCGIPGLNTTMTGEQAALSMLSTPKDLALAGHAMLSSKLVSLAATRRWMRHSSDTSNLRNGVGLPWEVYRAGTGADQTSPIIAVLTKAGAIGPYASYFGLSAELNVGFAILARDFSLAEGAVLDLNAYADVASEAIPLVLQLAAKDTASRYAGVFESSSGKGAIALKPTGGDPGLAVMKLTSGMNGDRDILREVAVAAGIDSRSLDFRLYPTNVKNSTHHQFVAVIQDKDAPVDAGTPTCITWQDVGSLENFPYKFTFVVGKNGAAKAVSVQGGERYART